MPKGQPTPEYKIERYWSLRGQGMTVSEAARTAGVSRRLASSWENPTAARNGAASSAKKRSALVPEKPIPLDAVCPEARAALDDRSGYLFAKRYFGWELSPFQQSVFRELEDAWESVDREYLCLNGPPGLGKSTAFVVFAAKRIVLWRAIRVMFMSRSASLALKNAGQLRRALERTNPAVAADATLAGDFGRFKPRTSGEVWRREEYVVEQMDGEPIEMKEATVTAFGFEAEWLGNRIDLLFGDDLDSTRSLGNMDTIERNREIYDGELEPRIGERGLFVIGQQRLGPFDFSAHVLSKRVMPDDDDGEGEDPEGVPLYRRIAYKVHYDEVCAHLPTEERRLLHRPDAPAYPEGCLLDPRRMPYRDVRKAMQSPRFRTVYQQEDTTETDALVQKVWVDGGRGTDGVQYLGCWDKDRGAWELPQGLSGLVGVVTVDPSPTRFWSVQAWAVHPASQQRYLLDLHRERMDAPDFLDWSHHLDTFTGIAEDWWHNFARLKVPLRYVIVEINAAQRFMLQYDHFHRWSSKREVLLLPHSTHRNKADDDYGVQMIRPRWQHGQVRLPYKGQGRISSLRLVDEVLRWPKSATDDCVMGQWFLEHALATSIIGTDEESNDPAWVPSWMGAVA